MKTTKNMSLSHFLKNVGKLPATNERDLYLNISALSMKYPAAKRPEFIEAIASKYKLDVAKLFQEVRFLERDKTDTHSDVVETDPFLVLAYLEKSLDSLKDPKSKMKAAIGCIDMRTNMMIHEHGKEIKEIIEAIDLSQCKLAIKDTILILDHLERAVLSLKRPVSRLQAWLSCAGIRGDIMYYEYGKEWKRC